jgi:hypothetical protein
MPNITAPMGLPAPAATQPMTALQKAGHWLAHRAGRYDGKPEMWWEGPKLMIGLRCGDCGKLFDVKNMRP